MKNKKSIIGIIMTAFLSIGITAFYYQQKYDTKIYEMNIKNTKVKASYLAFLVNRKNDELKELLTDLVQDNLLWIYNNDKNDKALLEFCAGWKDTLFKRAIKNKNYRGRIELKKLFLRLDAICK